MLVSMLKCPRCGRYTLGPRCPACGAETFDPEPPRFSPADRYGEQRRKALYGQV